MTNTNRAEKTRAVTAVMRRVPENGWRDNPTTGDNGILDALFGPSRKYRGQYGPKREPKPFTSRVYRYPMPEGPAGREYRAQVRAWGQAQGYTVKTCGLPEGWLLNAYVEATGNIWRPAETRVTA